MGISGLLPLLKDIQRPKHVKDYSGQTLGIDAYVWLHRGAYGCAREIIHGEPTNRYISYAKNMIQMLIHHGVKPYMVFDGDRLPAKQGTEEEREQRRSEYLARATALEAQGKMTEARELYTKCVDITPAMAFQLVKYLRKHGIPYVVSPYEADAQLAYLEQQGIIDGIITEDSDLLVFGCQKVLFKLDQGGSCIEILRSQFAAARQVVLAGWTPVEFRQMAILSGCDYLPSIVGMGLKNAHRLLRRHKTVEKVLQAVRLEGKMRVPTTYAKDFRKAELTFVHQRVWDPMAKSMTTLIPLPEGTVDEMVPFVGAPIDDELAGKIAAGDVDPVTRLKVVDLVPTQAPAKASVSRSSSDVNLRPRTEPRADQQRPALSRAITAPGSASLQRTSTPSTSAFYRAATPGKKLVSRETGLQTVKSFFAPTSSSKAAPKATPSVEAKPLPSQARVPLQARDDNRKLPFAFMSSSANGKAREVLDSDPFDENTFGMPTPSPKVKSKFFSSALKSGTKPIVSQKPALANPYLELDGKISNSQQLTPNIRARIDTLDDCDDLDDLIKSSPSQRSQQHVQPGLNRLLGAHLGKAEASSSPLPTPRDDDDTNTTPQKRKRERTMEGGRPFFLGGHNDDSDTESGFISSPASVKAQASSRNNPSDKEEGEDCSWSILPSIRGSEWSNMADAMSSDPIEADDEQESAAKAVGRSLMAKFCFQPDATTFVKAKKVSPPRGLMALQPVTPQQTITKLATLRHVTSEPKRLRKAASDFQPTSMPAPVSEGRPPFRTFLSSSSAKAKLSFVGDHSQGTTPRCKSTTPAFLDQFKYDARAERSG